jgi:hypothetical protein
MQRYAISQVDKGIFQVVDLIEQREICTCSDYDDWEDAEERATNIPKLLNANS